VPVQKEQELRNSRQNEKEEQGKSTDMLSTAAGSSSWGETPAGAPQVPGEKMRICR